MIGILFRKNVMNDFVRDGIMIQNDSFLSGFCLMITYRTLSILPYSLWNV